MEPFKNIYNRSSITKLALDIRRGYRQFDELKFITACTRGLQKLEMKERVLHITNVLKLHLPTQYTRAIDVMVRSLAPQEFHEEQEWAGQEVEGVTGFMVWPLLTFIEHYGLDDLETSLAGMYEMTKRFSAEFAIRPFIQRYDKQIFTVLTHWTCDKSKHVRRLCSEGTRPNLPWGKKVATINKNLARNIDLLERLKTDPEEYVQRSVANHLNDLSRIDRDLLLTTLTRWQNPKLKVPKKIIRHASRTLLKEGNPTALMLHGYCAEAKIAVSAFTISQSSVREGETVEIEVTLSSKSAKTEQVLLEYIVYYLRANGEYSRKTFRLKDFKLASNETLTLSKTISFRRVTTRRHYTGLHRLALQVNGRESQYQELELQV
jgi:3-methyladenine DNA glycosylase AlkC